VAIATTDNFPPLKFELFEEAQAYYTGLPSEAARSLAKSDLYYLLRYVCNRQDVEHPWVYARCWEVMNDPYGYLDLWCREHYKSTIITFGQTLQLILRDPEKTHCILSYNNKEATKHFRQIKLEMERNQRLKALFPDILYGEPKKEAPKWSENEGLVVRRNGNPKEATLEAYGLVDNMPTGSHFDDLVYDDVVTQDSVTDHMLVKTTNSWELSVNLGKDGGTERYAGTRYDDADTYGAILERKAAIPRIYPGTEDGTATGRPVLYSEEWLEDRRIKMTDYNFGCQILLDPVPGKDGYFRRDMFQWYDWADRPDFGYKMLASDYCLTHGTGDWAVHGVALVDPETDDLYVVDWWRAKVEPHDAVDVALELIEKHKPRDYVYEKAAVDQGIVGFLNKRIVEEGAYATVHDYPAAGKKDVKAQGIRARTGHGKVFLPRDAPWTDDLLRELLRFPHGVHDDQVDVMSLFGRHLDKMGKAYRKVKEEPKAASYEDMEKMRWRQRQGIGGRRTFLVGNP
jgi:predicted phage terminase large subunit-like protein